MPVKWTPDNDQLLLLKILETHDISVDARKISAAWPSEKGEVPTARAITERLVKIRQLARANGAGHFGISSSQAKSSSGKSGTPRKPGHARPAAASKTDSSYSRGDNALNGDRNRYYDDDDDDDEVFGQDRSPISPAKRKHDALRAERGQSTAALAAAPAQVKVESIEVDGFEVMQDGSSFSGAARSPSLAHGLQRGGAGGSNAHAMAQLRVHDDDSPTKRPRVDKARVDRPGTEGFGNGVGGDWSSGQRAQAKDGYVDEDDDDDDDAV